MTTPLIIDTDTAGDDCLAILEGALDPSANLVGVTICAGNIGFEGQTRNAQLTLNACGKLGQIPVYLGAQTPLKKVWHSATEVFGDGVGGLRADLSNYSVDKKSAVDALIEESKTHQGKLKVICIAPLTNIALAIQKDPDFATRVEGFYVMGGSNNGHGNVTAAAEFNFFVDPDAAQILFKSGAKITVITWDPITLRDALFNDEQRDSIAKLKTGLSKFFQDVNRDALAFDQSVGIPGSTHPDSITCAIALHPEIATKIAPYNVEIECESTLTSGYSAMSWAMPGKTSSVHGLPLNAHVVEQADNEAFFNYLSGLLSKEIKPNVDFFYAQDDKKSDGRLDGDRGVGYVQ